MSTGASRTIVLVESGLVHQSEADAALMHMQDTLTSRINAIPRARSTSAPSMLATVLPYLPEVTTPGMMLVALSVSVVYEVGPESKPG